MRTLQQLGLAERAALSINITVLQDAFGMLTEMGKQGVMPTVDTFNTLMDACIRRVNPAAVPRLFKQMEQSGMCMGNGSLVQNNSWSYRTGRTGSSNCAAICTGFLIATVVMVCHAGLRVCLTASASVGTCQFWCFMHRCHNVSAGNQIV